MFKVFGCKNKRDVEFPYLYDLSTLAFERKDQGEKELWFNQNRGTAHGIAMGGKIPHDVQGDYGYCGKRVEKGVESANAEYISFGSAENGIGGS